MSIDDDRPGRYAVDPGATVHARRVVMGGHAPNVVRRAYGPGWALASYPPVTEFVDRQSA